MAESSPIMTPKRKRETQHPPITPIKFSFDLPGEDSAEDGGSPRSRFAHRFKGLDLGSGVTASGSDDHDLSAPGSPRKRHKIEEVILSPAKEDGPQLQDLSPPKPAVEGPAAASPSHVAGRGRQSSISPKSKTPKKRSGTPPLKAKTSLVQEHEAESDGEDEVDITDPVRAALTWHDDEITIYDPDDEDDDGTGVNGVGFKPTPAVAHARAMRRRQQLAEYRRREESDARAQRNQRRKDGAAARHEDKLSARKVRFTEAERQKVSATMG